MPYLPSGDASLELFRASEVVDELPILKTVTVTRDEIQKSTASPSLGAAEQKRLGGITFVGMIAVRTKPGESEGVVVDSGGAAVPWPSTSPEEARRLAPAVKIGPCPVRLTPMIPPMNYGTVEKHMIFRSAFPNERNLDFLGTLGVQSILALVDTPPTEAYSQFVRQHGINRHCVMLAPNKDGRVSTSLESLCEALLFALDPKNHPLYIHCNQGRHRTGCVVACLRKIQQWPLDEILAEYDAYASPKARTGDVDLITAFDPQAVYRYAKSKGIIQNWARLARTSLAELTDVHGLAAALPKHKSSQLRCASSQGPRSASGFSFLPRSWASQRFASVPRSVRESADEFEPTAPDGLQDCSPAGSNGVGC